MNLRKTRSSDGIDIAYSVSGQGPPLVLVHGTSSVRGRWAPILSALEQSFTVCAVDRRGRGDSGDSPDYTIQREFEDVAAVIEAVANDCQSEVYVLAHSYGALCTVEAALLTDKIARMALYESPLPTGEAVTNPAVLKLLQDNAAAGENEALVINFVRKVVRIPDEELELLKSTPAWNDRIAIAPTIPRELASLDHDYAFTPGRYKQVDVPTLLIHGSDSPAFFVAAAHTLHDDLPISELAVLEGQQHNAIDAAPDLFAKTVIEFLLRK